MKQTTKNSIFSITSFFMAAIILGLAMAIHHNTLIEWWKPVIFSLIPVLPIGVLAFMKAMSQGNLRGSHITLAAALTTLSFSIILGGFYLLNFYLPKSDSEIAYSAPVIRKYSEEHYKTERMSRNRVRRGAKYLVYCIDVQLPDDHFKKLNLKISEYNNIRTGDSIRLKIVKGLFGFPVIKDTTIPKHKRGKKTLRWHPPHHRTPYKETDSTY